MAKKHQEKGRNASIEEFSARIKKADLNTYFIFGAIILVLIVGIYAIFSPDIQNSKLGNPACGKIIIAADGPKLANMVAPSLSEARFFLVVDPLSKKLLEAIRNPYRGPQPNPQIVYLIAGKGEEAVIVGSVDQQSYNMLMQYGIRVFGGYEGQARNVINLYRKARISQLEPAAPAGPAPTQAAWGAQDIFAPSCPNPFMQGGMAQAGMIQPGQGMQDMFYPYCPNPMLQGAQAGNGMQSMNNNMGNQAAFGWGEQPFVCPNCNWRIKCKRQGNGFPDCPNCGSPMATDVSTANPIGQWWREVRPAANMEQLMPQMNQMTNQPDFWQGPESTKFFLCPNCNWRMYAQAGQNEFPQCPNCKQIMARAGAYPQGQGTQYNQAAPTQAALQAPAIAPAIAMPHTYRGECSNCHRIMEAPAGVQQSQAVNNSTRVVLGQSQN
jgi:predicted Fe-Mo cluster-binding NifX family protein/transcription initiation factor IIE alpha subunit